MGKGEQWTVDLPGDLSGAVLRIELTVDAEDRVQGRVVASIGRARSEQVLGFRREDVGHSCNGFGMLIPKIEGFKILGTIFSSALFPNRAPAGHIALTSYIGGARYPELGLLPSEQLIETTLADLRVLLGVKGQPVFTHTKTWPKAIPQYNVGYGKYRELLNDMEAKSPGLFFAGCYRDGVSLGDSIISGVNIAERVGKTF